MTESNFIFGYAIVEGQTESDFFDKVLNPYLNISNIHVEPIVVQTSPGNKGGGVSLERLRRDYDRIANHGNTRLILICLDFHRLPEDFPNYRKTNSPVEDAKAIELGLKRFLKGDFRLFPHIQLHDFEALLFSDPDAFQRTGLCGAETVGILHTIKANFDSPEHINHGTPPAYHIQTAMPRYRKRINGPAVAKEIGLERIREECTHFSNWLDDFINFARSLS